MDREASINLAEKQRQRDDISEQVKRFLENGGNITVVDGPAPGSVYSPRGSTWHSDDVAPTLD